MRKIARNYFNAFEKSKEGRKNIFMGNFAETFIKCRNVANIVYNTKLKFVLMIFIDCYQSFFNCNLVSF